VSNVESNDDKKTDMETPQREIGALEAFWSLFSSMKTAIALLLALAVASIAGTILEDKKGISIYSSTWFSLILVLVGVNLAVCSINRFGIAWRRTFRPKVESTPESVAGMMRSESVTCGGSLESVTDQVIRALRSRSYRLIRQSKDAAVSIYAAKGRASIWGPYLTHLSILVIFAGAIYGSMVGSEGNVIIAEGERVSEYSSNDNSESSVPFGFEVALHSFTIKNDESHNVMGYESDLEIFDGGRSVARKVIDVNHPLSYNGVSLYQSGYGLAGLVVKVVAPDGETVDLPYNIGEEQGEGGPVYAISDEPWKQFSLGGKALILFVHNLVPDYIGGEMVNGSPLPLNPGVNLVISDQLSNLKAKGAWTRLGWLTTYTPPVTYKGFTVTLDRVRNYTSLSVSRNPGLPVVYLGFALMVLGVFMSFYVTFKVVRVNIAQPGDGVKVIIGGTTRSTAAVFDKDFKRLRDTLG